MSANTNPIFALTPETKIGLIDGACTDKTGATTAEIVDLVTGGTNGTKVTEIGFKCQGTSVAGQLLIFITDTSGTTYRLFAEIAISAVTSSNTVASNSGYLTFSDLQLKTGQKIAVAATAIDTNIVGYAKIGDF